MTKSRQRPPQRIPSSRLLNARNRAGRDGDGDGRRRSGRPWPAGRHRPAGARSGRLCPPGSDLVAFKPLLRSHASPDKPIPAAGETTTRERLAEQLLEVVAADFAQNGPTSSRKAPGDQPDRLGAVRRRVRAVPHAHFRARPEKKSRQAPSRATAGAVNNLLKAIRWTD